MSLGIANQTWLTAVPNGSGVYAVASVQYPQITAWSNTTAYNAGAIVTAPDGNQYQAVIANTGVQPPAAGTWTRSAYTTPDKGLIAQSAVPLPYIPQWDPATAYAGGTIVQYGANLFVTPNGSVGVPPSTLPDNNSGWEFYAGQNAYTASFYAAGNMPLTSGYTATDYAGIGWYDANGALIAVPSGMSPSGTVINLPVYQRLRMSLAELGGTNGNTLALNWTVTPTGFWQVAAGQLYPNPNWSGSQKIKLAYVTDSRSDGCVGITCQTGVPNSNTGDNGVLFRLTDTNNFWLACRSKIQKMVAGTLTTVASYSRIPIGARIYVQMSGSTIKLYWYPGNAQSPALAATVTDSFNQSATSHGVYSQVY